MLTVEGTNEGADAGVVVSWLLLVVVVCETVRDLAVDFRVGSYGALLATEVLLAPSEQQNPQKAKNQKSEACCQSTVGLELTKEISLKKIGNFSFYFVAACSNKQQELTMTIM